ncbi:hypothetical protein [Bacillus sp. NPDC077027]|uniref:hypothetical protein n=1 Tax=Bacillus sp. NPDC077027 TaxID=3390548 RepID=UPI003CFF6D1C
MTQLDIFQYLEKEEKTVSFSVGDKVRVKTGDEIQKEGCTDIETISYLDDYRFGGKEGLIIDILGLTYVVRTKIGKAYVTKEELADIR